MESIAMLSDTTKHRHAALLYYNLQKKAKAKHSSPEQKTLQSLLLEYEDKLQMLQFNPWYSDYHHISLLECDDPDGNQTVK